MQNVSSSLFLSLGGKQGTPYALAFAGQATPWQDSLQDAIESREVRSAAANLMESGQALLAPLGRTLHVITGGRHTLDSLLQAEAFDPSASMPGILLAQHTALLALAEDGFDTRVRKPAAVVGHSQGVLGKALFDAWAEGDTDRAAQVYALAEMLGAAVSSQVARESLGKRSNRFPMLAIQGAGAVEIQELIRQENLEAQVFVALVNGPDQVVVSGTPENLRRLELAATARSAEQKRLIANKVRGGLPFDPKFTYLKVDAPFHSPLLEGALEEVRHWSQKVGIDPALVEELAPAVLTNSADWAEELAALLSSDAKWIVDLGPGSALTRITSSVLLGSGIGVIEAGTAAERDAFLTVGNSFQAPRDWTRFHPRVLDLPGGKQGVETAFTRLTGRSPILLAGMTPTTVDPEIVAAAANAGHWAELAGGGQVTEAVFADNLAKLRALLEPGRAAQFNAMFLDPYLWNLQFGAQSIVTKARAAGAPLDGVVISAGIPELEEATALVTSLQSAGFPYVAFKPGTAEQIRQVVQIARAVPEAALIVQVEDGHAGGHHSWENLDDLLLATYAEIRDTDNLVLCAGGGIGTPERAADYISGQWALSYGRPLMPVDGVLIGTAAMTALEAKTTAEVKALLVETPGIPGPSQLDQNGGWVEAGKTRGGVTSGQSHLRADIHEVDNAAAACARLVAEVSGNDQLVQERRAEIIAALDATAKPYFGDVQDMTYLGWARRFADLSFPWADPTWVNRFQLLLHRIEGRLAKAESGTVPTLFPEVSDVEDARAALDLLSARYPASAETRVTPTDAAWFVDLCRKYPKPMPFVPVLDSDLLRWWGQDNLWQSQDPRYRADQVRIIPGPVSVAGIDRVDEPIGELLGRFEAACVARLTDSGAPSLRAFSRLDDCADPLDFVFAAPFVSWSQNLVDNPARVLGRELISVETAPEPGVLNLVIDLDTSWDDVPGGDDLHAVRSLTIPISLGKQSETGGYAVVDAGALPQHMYALLAKTAGVGGETITGDPIGALPQMRPSKDSEFGEAHWSFTANRELADLHRGVTGGALPGGFDLATWTPDALLGLCWPAIYAALGSALVGDYPVIEGLLSAVHLDHTARLDIDLSEAVQPGEDVTFTVVARCTDLAESSAGRVVTVRETLFLDGEEVGEFQERFAIRGRIGSDVLPTDVAPAAGLGQQVQDTPRSQLRRARVQAPTDMTAFANVSGDFNPIHTSFAAAQVAGLEAPLVHGMWLSALAQNLVQAGEGSTSGNTILGWTYNMYGLVNLGDTVDVTVERIGRIPGGGLLLEVTCKIDGQVVSRATALTKAPVTAYVYPGQGIQKQGMALDEIPLSPAAAEVWERADALTRDKLGFSILTVVQDNPVELEVAGVPLRHPEGLLNLTQFTQVALATVAFAQTARLRESGSLVEDAFFAGHSLGEYNALSAYGQVFPLETVLEIVFHRGSTMHHLVERDENGASNYRMGALRPNQFGVQGSEVEDYVASVSEASGEFLEIVNFNLAGQQYAVAGTIAGLRALEADANAKAEEFGGKPPFMYVPGVDVPFHSTVLRGGVAEFREKLQDLLPAVIPTSRLEGKYIPNLVALPFEPTREFAEAILAQVPSEPIQALLTDEDAWEWAASDPDQLSRLLLIELLAWQFASPVRWIQTQELMLTPAKDGGLGVERLVEIGLGFAPTLAGLAEKTLKLDQLELASATALNVQRDEQVVNCTDVRFVEQEATPQPTPEQEQTPQVRISQAQNTPADTESANTEVGLLEPTVPVAAGAPVEDIPFHAGDAVKVLMAFTNKLRPDQIEVGDTTDTLTAGVSARRNQLLMDLSAELGLPSIDGAADASVAELCASVDKLAHNYRPFGPVLSEAIRDRFRKVFGGAGVKSSFISDYLRDVWQLGDGWVSATQAQVLLGTREGDSARGGSLATLEISAGNLAAAEALVDAAVAQVGAARGVPVAKPSAQGASGGVVDSAALDAYAESVTGETGALAEAARHMLQVLGLDGPSLLPTGVPEGNTEGALDALAAQTVAAELGPRWVQMVTPVFSPEKAVLLDDRWASTREDLAKLWHSKEPLEVPLASFIGAGPAVAQQAKWWAQKAEEEGLTDLADLYREAGELAASNSNAGLPYAGQVAVVSGATPTSIAGALAARLLAGGATVVLTASRLDAARLDFAKRLYRENATGDAKLWLVPANLASYRDIDALVQWVGTEQTRAVGPVTEVVKPALVPDLFFPFAAPPVTGSLSQSGETFEAQARVLLWGVERALAGFAELADKDASAPRVHVVLPGSPNRGTFGGDGAYGETKAAFDAIVNKWEVEKIWARATSIAHPQIGWVAGTGLMGGNDPLVAAAEAAGIRTFTTDEIAEELLELCTPVARKRAAKSPLVADLTGGLSDGIDLAALKAASQETPAESAPSKAEPASVPALPTPTAAKLASFTPEDWAPGNVPLEDMVVVVSVGEVGAWGSGRTRWQAELGLKTDGQVDLTPAGVLELAWMMGLLTWQDSPESGWYDTDGNLVEPGEVFDRYRDQVVARSGVRSFISDAGIEDLGTLEETAVFLNTDVTFTVPDQKSAESFVTEEPELTRVRPLEDGEWEVTRLAGSRARLPRRATLTRTVGGQFPTGFDPAKWGLSPSLLESMDRIAAWNLVSAVDAFISAGFSPAELLQAVHPADVASTQGTGFGGMTSMRKLFVDRFLGEDYPADILQETLPNVVAAHTMQTYIGGYGAMVQPVSACATAAVSLEEGVDKIKTGKAKFVVAGATDDLSVESLVGFGSMNATADSAAMAAKGVQERFYSRANDRRRGGFIEAQGGGTILLARGDVAAQLGLPVSSVVAFAQSFADGINTSIPAPGLGALAAARGGTDSGLARSLGSFGLTADDIAFVSKHDTSTNANDPNESDLHTRVASALERSEGNPLFVVSQKSVTGHAKGGACVFQVAGVGQAFRDGVLPANRSLDCVDRALEGNPWLVWLREPLEAGTSEPFKAALVTSLGFGHVSSLLALVHPGAFEVALAAQLGDEAAAQWRSRASERLAQGVQDLEAGMLGRAELFTPTPSRRLPEEGGQVAKEAEAAMLLDPDARLQADGRYAHA